MHADQQWRRSGEYRRWRINVIRRDSRCVCCNSIHERQAHHLEDASHNPDLRYTVDNGVTLCRLCHTALHTMYKKSYRMKCTQDDFINFLDLYRFVENRGTYNVLTRLQKESFTSLK